jgi:ketosteroid isomerase-like protein
VGEAESEIVRRAFEAFNEGGIEAAEFAFHPEMEVIPFAEWPGPGTYEGIAGMREIAREWTESFNDYRFEIREVVPLPSGAMALLEQRGRIKGADDWISMEIGSIWEEFENGRARRVRFFSSWAAAEEAAAR